MVLFLLQRLRIVYIAEFALVDAELGFSEIYF